MVQSLLYGQNVISFIHLDVQNKEAIKLLVGKNLRRLRDSRRLTQDQLGGMLNPSVDGSHIASIESGKGVSDEVLSRLCNALKLDVWEFYWTEKTPIVRDAREMADLEQRREAERIGIADMVREAEASWITAAKKKSGASGKDAQSRSKRTHKRAG